VLDGGGGATVQANTPESFGTRGGGAALQREARLTMWQGRRKRGRLRTVNEPVQRGGNDGGMQNPEFVGETIKGIAGTGGGSCAVVVLGGKDLKNWWECRGGIEGRG